MVAVTALQLWRRHLQWQYLNTESHKNLPVGTKIDRGTHRQDGDLISLLFSFRNGSSLEVQSVPQRKQLVSTKNVNTCLFLISENFTRPISTLGEQQGGRGVMLTTHPHLVPRS
jgi:hypothetical protein